MLVALMTKSKVDTRAVLRGRPDEVGHDLWDVEGQLALGLEGHVGEPAWGCEGRSIAGPLRSTAGVDLLSAFLGLLLPEWSSLEGHPPTDLDLLLSLSLQAGPLGESLNDLPCVPHAAGHVHDSLVADQVRQAVDLPEELGLQAVDVLLLPQPGCHHRGTSID